MRRMGAVPASKRKQGRANVRKITTRTQLIQLANDLRVRDDWHEPDELGLEVHVWGREFDNAGFWGDTESSDKPYEELHVTLYQNGLTVASVNLATLFAFACGTYEGN
jgi:hypothetical protein